MRTLIVPVGAPASGKSTWCKKMWDDFGIISVSSDLMRKELYGDESIQGDYHEVFGAVYDAINNFFDMGYNPIILDATNVTRQVRYKAIQDTQPQEIIYVTFNIEFETLIERNNKRKRHVPSKVINKMYGSFCRDYPCESKDFFYNIKCSIYSFDDKNLYYYLEQKVNDILEKKWVQL